MNADRFDPDALLLAAVIRATLDASPTGVPSGLNAAINRILDRKDFSSLGLEVLRAIGDSSLSRLKTRRIMLGIAYAALPRNPNPPAPPLPEKL